MPCRGEFGEGTEGTHGQLKRVQVLASPLEASGSSDVPLRPQDCRQVLKQADRSPPLGPSARLHVCLPPPRVRLTPRISCEAVPPPIRPAGAQGGTSARSSGAALSFVSCIRLLGGPYILQMTTLPLYAFTTTPSFIRTKRQRPKPSSGALGVAGVIR